MTKTKLFLLSAGGTGGHLFPAEALAHELTARGHRVHLVTDSRAERFSGKFPASDIHVVRSATIGSKNPIKVIKSLWTLFKGVREAGALIRKIRPDAVIGFGGYPTIPPLLAASNAGLPTMLHEQNAVMGRANRALASRVKAIAGGFLPEGKGRYADKTVITGNPVRPEVIAAAAIPYVPSVDGEPFRLVVFGGSQGAQFFSDAIPSAIGLLPEPLRARLRAHPAGQARGRSKCQGAARGNGRRGRGLAVLHRHGCPYRRGASGDFAVRRLDRLRDRRDWPFRHPGALSLCTRS
jgi:UDP-N-acetylglucosamine--N-acetylmuramyl-(pentapeptide) pyrophosphoryl-undecaprenol N-acetylglucosamine transferase